MALNSNTDVQQATRTSSVSYWQDYAEDGSSSTGPGSDNNDRSTWTVCGTCHGNGKIHKPPTRKARLRHKRSRLLLEQQQQKSSSDTQQQHPSSDTQQQTLSPPPGRAEPCTVCHGSGLVSQLESSDAQAADRGDGRMPKIAIVGGGLAGLALAAACRHRGVDCVVYERDGDFQERSQGYGLTMQQASRALAALGVSLAEDGTTSTKHVVHDPDGNVVGQWGLRHWKNNDNHGGGKTNSTTTKPAKEPKRQNVHIARQALRYHLLMAAGGHNAVRWNHKLVDYKESSNKVTLTLAIKQKDKEEPVVVQEDADLLVGADGIRGAVRRQLVGENTTPLRYLDCIVILGICPLEQSDTVVATDHKAWQSSQLLDGETVFQTADGVTRIYVMPYSKTACMWQLSFPMSEDEAKKLSALGSRALQKEALSRCSSWHKPVPEILDATPTHLVSGYPVYDRELLTHELLKRSKEPIKNETSEHALNTSTRVTLVGDAAHPMSPFKGQGANQALLDSLSLARAIYQEFRHTKESHLDTLSQTNVQGPGGEDGVLGSDDNQRLETALERYHEDMLTRSAAKVQASAHAAQFLHTEVAIAPGNVTRGGAAAAASTS